MGLASLGRRGGDYGYSDMPPVRMPSPTAEEAEYGRRAREEIAKAIREAMRNVPRPAKVAPKGVWR